MTTDTTIEGPVIWAAAWPTIRKMASDQYPDNPLLTKLVISGQVMALNCWTTRLLISSSLWNPPLLETFLFDWLWTRNMHWKNLDRFWLKVLTWWLLFKRAFAALILMEVDEMRMDDVECIASIIKYSKVFLIPKNNT